MVFCRLGKVLVKVPRRLADAVTTIFVCEGPGFVTCADQRLVAKENMIRPELLASGVSGKVVVILL